MDRLILVIASMVFVVTLVGLFTIDVETGITGYAVHDHCGQCTGNPVCAVKGEYAVDYPNACAAECDGARVLTSGLCSEI